MGDILADYVRKTKIFTSNRTDSLEKKVNDFLATIPVENIMQTHYTMGFTEKRGYMLSYAIDYLEKKEGSDEQLSLDFNIDFGVGEPNPAD